MYVGITDEDMKKKGFSVRDGARTVIRFCSKGGVQVPAEELIGKTFKLVRAPANDPSLGYFIELVEQGHDADSAK